MSEMTTSDRRATELDLLSAPATRKMTPAQRRVVLEAAAALADPKHLTTGRAGGLLTGGSQGAMAGRMMAAGWMDEDLCITEAGYLAAGIEIPVEVNEPITVLDVPAEPATEAPVETERRMVAVGDVVTFGQEGALYEVIEVDRACDMVRLISCDPNVEPVAFWSTAISWRVAPIVVAVRTKRTEYGMWRVPGAFLLADSTQDGPAWSVEVASWYGTAGVFVPARDDEPVLGTLRVGDRLRIDGDLYRVARETCPNASCLDQPYVEKI